MIVEIFRELVKQRKNSTRFLFNFIQSCIKGKSFWQRIALCTRRARIPGHLVYYPHKKVNKSTRFFYLFPR